MLNDVKTPPIQPLDGSPPISPPSTPTLRQPYQVPVVPTPAVAKPEDITIDPKEVGRHKSRTFGAKTKLDVEYAMPMEERGSTFNVSLSIIGLIIVATVLFIVYRTIR